MKKIIIIGNSGAARECYWLLQEVFACNNTKYENFMFGGFLAWKGYKGDLKELAICDLGHSDDYTIFPEDVFVIGVGKPQLRQQIFEEFSARHATFMNLIHPSVYVCPSAKIGTANILQRGSTVYCNAQIGHGNYLNGAVNLAHDAQIGDFNLLGPYCMVLGNAVVGACNQLAPHCVLLNNTKIGNNNILSPSTYIYKGCKDNYRMSGNPALKIGQIDTILKKKAHEV